MLSLKLYYANFDTHISAPVQALKAELATRFTPLVSPALQTVADVLGAAPEVLRADPDRQFPATWDLARDQPKLLDGEIFTTEGGLLVFTYKQRQAPSTSLQIATIATSWDTHIFDELPERVAAVLGFPINAFAYGCKKFDEFRAEGRLPPELPSAKESAAVTVLLDRPARTLLTAIKTSGGLLTKDVAKQLSGTDREAAPSIIDKLKETKLIDSEVVVVCAKSGAQVARAPTVSVVTALATQRIKCACGRNIADENIEEAVSVTELGRGLLDKNRWLTILLQTELIRTGVHRDAILVEQQIGGDEIDCLANVSGELVLFELKDKQFSLGNAYSFGAKIGVTRPDHPVVITTETVGNDAKDHFVRARLAGGPRKPDYVFRDERRPAAIRYIEGIDNLRTGLQDLVSDIYRRDAQRILDEVFPLASVSGERFLRAFEQMHRHRATVCASGEAA